MKLKRIFPLFLAIVMVLSTVVAVPLTVGAEEAAATEATGANESTAGYQEIAPGSSVKVPAGTTPVKMATFTTTYATVAPTEKAYVYIEDANDLIAFSKYVRSRAGAKTFVSGSVVYLTADIDMKDQTMSPIGGLDTTDGGSKTNTGLQGGTTFDGNGYKIKNLKMTRDTTYGGNQVGLFGIVWSTVKNVYLDESCTFTQDVNAQVGSVVAALYGGGQAYNCYSAATVIASGCDAGVGGMFGAMMEPGNIIDNCTFAGKVSTNNTNIGGVVGEINRNWRNNGAYTVTDCVNVGSVLQHTYSNSAGAGHVGAGGIAGVYNAIVGNQLTISNCINKSSDIGVQGLAGHVAGILSFYRTKAQGTATKAGLIIQDCTNAGNLYNYALTGDVNRVLRTSDIYNVMCAAAGAFIIPTDETCPVTLTNCKEAPKGYNECFIEEANTNGLTDLKDVTATAAADFTESAYVISDKAGLIKFNEICNSTGGKGAFNNKTVYLVADVDLEGYSWKSIQNGNNMTLDGQGHRIKNLVCDGTVTAYLGFFANADPTIQNLILDASCIFRSAETYIGAFVGHSNSAKIINCMNEATVIAAGASTKGYAGGIVNGAAAYVCHTTNRGTVLSAGNFYAAGIHGSSSTAGGAVINCANYGTVAAQNGTALASNNSHHVAGIVAAAGTRGNIAILGNVNYGTLMSGTGHLSGIVMMTGTDTGVQVSYVQNNTNYGTYAEGDNAVTGNAGVIVGYYADSLSKAVMSNNVDAAGYIGYNADMIAKISDYTYIPEITEAFTLAADGKSVSVVNTPPMVKISNAKSLRLLSAVAYYAPANLRTMKVVLADNISLAGYTYDPTNLFATANCFLPIGWETSGAMMDIGGVTGKPSYYTGIFDGQGYAVDNWAINGLSKDGDGTHNIIGLFGVVNHGIIQNLGFGENNSYSGHNVVRLSMINDLIWSNVNNCYNKTSFGNSHIRMSGGIANCVNYSGVTNCTNDGDISGYHGAGGIAGMAQASTIANCRNNGTVSATYNGGANVASRNANQNWAGGILAYSKDAQTKVFNNVNNGKIIISADQIGAHENDGTSKTYAAFGGAIIARVNGTTQVANNMDYAGVYKTDDMATNTKFMYHSTVAGGTVTNLTTATLVANEDRAFLDEMLHTRYQAKATETVEGATVQDIRLVATVDAAANYQVAGFKLTNKTVGSEDYGLTYNAVTKTAYSSLLAMAAGGEETCNPEEYGASTSEYFFAYVLNNVAAGETIEAQSYVVTQDGTYLWGDVLTITIPAAVID